MRNRNEREMSCSNSFIQCQIADAQRRGSHATSVLHWGLAGRDQTQAYQLADTVCRDGYTKKQITIKVEIRYSNALIAIYIKYALAETKKKNLSLHDQKLTYLNR